MFKARSGFTGLLEFAGRVPGTDSQYGLENPIPSLGNPRVCEGGCFLNVQNFEPENDSQL